jgi:PKD repeat protein
VSKRKYMKRVTLIVFMAMLAVAALAPAAQASRGLLSAFGEIGTGADQFAYSGPDAVDPTDGNAVYAADIKEGLFGRVRKFDTTGKLLGTAEVPLGGPEFIAGIAVDGSEHRLYVLVDANSGGDPAHPNAPAVTRILAYSTEPEPNGTLPFATGTGISSGVLYDFQASGGSIDFPEGFAVDPGTHKLVVLGSYEAGGVISDELQYITDSGSLSKLVKNPTGVGAVVSTSKTMVVGPNGTVYLLRVGDGRTPVYSLPREGGSLTQVLSADLVTSTPVASGAVESGVGVGSQLAISSDGATMYLAEGGSSESGHVRAFSVATGKPLYLFAEGDCGIAHPLSSFGLAAGSNGVLAAVTTTEESPLPGESAVHVFGDGGTPCPSEPIADFTIEGGAAINKGESRTLTLSAAGLHGFTPAEVDWDFDGDGTFETKETGGSLTTTHRFAVAGTYEISEKVILENGEESSPVSQSVTVAPVAPVASFKASNKAPALGEEVTFDAGLSVDPAGSPTGESTHELAAYRWDFGDGSTLETTTPVITHAYAAAGAKSVKLVVVNHEGLASTPVAQVVTVASPPAPGGGDSGGGSGSSPSPSPAPTTPAPTTPAPPKPTTPAKPKPLVCKKGFAKKKGKCVKAPAKHKKHGKKKHAKKPKAKKA